MPKIKLPRNSPSMDMTPLVDLGFLLVTFFMLTSQFRPDEPVTPDTPASISEIKLPESNMIVITVDQDNRVYYTFDGQEQRKTALASMGEKYKVSFTNEEAVSFSNLTSFGVPMKDLKQWLSLEGESRKSFPQTGIPMDSLNNELYDWINFSRRSNAEPYRIAVKGDRLAKYETIKRVIQVLGENEIYKFNLVTDMRVE